ncbi:hypothetical protein VOLCADRAFT_107261 [Volvox carteri f. nagariensis]|uniref:Uncharacterized protein n=1 Tax=Volvox carteri f. nagariensis TaxID=3068 RepID=D8UCW3_VOLCA|nr:uncharacterized protein VOLCADRAFT_107261 [Volvox carteri f. nagariensis]EFJ42460.1 hypothetical protein VOLCADRAFT_107261 [Volvox carteri f. nagariensis]|eukprot:XP_002956523.1 hypothetical protein VOLCADRAFT_107261 [Volvox carteri f. nagariensis]
MAIYILARRCAGGAWTRLESSLNKIQATLTNLQLSVPIVTVTPSSCSSTQRKQIEEAVSVRFNYVTAAQAPCCCPFAKPWSPWSPEEPPRFSWGRADVVVLPVQAIEWLAGGVLCGDINIVIKTSKTDYIFVPEAAWKDCQERFGAELFEGYKLRVTSGTTTSALLSMIDSVIALYEAKTEKALKDGLPSVRAQALLEYLAINQMKDWPTDDVIVLFGDLNRHYVVHAGRKDTDAPKRSIHVAGPAPLPAVLEESPSTAADRSPLSSTLGFIRALLETSRTEEASSTGGGLGRGATRNDEGGSGSGGQGATNSHREGAHGSGGGASGSGGRGAGSDSGHSDAADAADTWAGAGSGRRHRRSGSSGADSSGGSVGGESFDGDEGILEAARDNTSAQAFMSLLRLPEVYEPLGFKEPPKSFRPPTKEELLARFRPFEVIHTAALPQPLPHALLAVTRCSPAARGITKPRCPAVASFHHRWGGHEQQGLGTIELGHWVWRDSGGVGVGLYLSLDRAQRDGKMAGSWTFRDYRSIENVLIGLQTAELQEPPITGSVSELSEVKSMSSAPAVLMWQEAGWQRQRAAASSDCCAQSCTTRLWWRGGSCSRARNRVAALLVVLGRPHGHSSRGLRRAYSNAVPSGMAMGAATAASPASIAKSPIFEANKAALKARLQSLETPNVPDFDGKGPGGGTRGSGARTAHGGGRGGGGGVTSGAKVGRHTVPGARSGAPSPAVATPALAAVAAEAAGGGKYVAEVHKEATPSVEIKGAPGGGPSPHPIALRDVQALVTWVLSPAGNLVESPRWAFVKNKPLVQGVVLVLASGLSSAMMKEKQHLLPFLSNLGQPAVVHISPQAKPVEGTEDGGGEEDKEEATAGGSAAATAAVASLAPPKGAAAERRGKGGRAPPPPPPPPPSVQLPPGPFPPSHYVASLNELKQHNYPLPYLEEEEEGEGGTGGEERGGEEEGGGGARRGPQRRLVCPPGFVATRPSGNKDLNRMRVRLYEQKCKRCIKDSGLPPWTLVIGTESYLVGSGVVEKGGKSSHLVWVNPTQMDNGTDLEDGELPGEVADGHETFADPLRKQRKINHGDHAGKHGRHGTDAGHRPALKPEPYNQARHSLQNQGRRDNTSADYSAALLRREYQQHEQHEHAQQQPSRCIWKVCPERDQGSLCADGSNWILGRARAASPTSPA